MKILLTSLSFLNFKRVSFFNILKKYKIKYLEIIPKFFFKSKKTKIFFVQSIYYNFKSKNFNRHIVHFKKISNLCKKYNINKFSLGSYPLRKKKFNIKSTLENKKFLREICKIAQKNNQIICIEPVGQKYGSNFLKTHYQVYNFVKNEKIKNLKLLFDTGNLRNQKNYKTQFIKYKNYIEHIHLSNKNIKKLDINFIKERIYFLTKNNYKKTLTIEWVNKSINTEKLEELLDFVK